MTISTVSSTSLDQSDTVPSSLVTTASISEAPVYTRSTSDVQEDNLTQRSETPPVAICGIGLRLPGRIKNCEDYWDLLESGRDARGLIPPSRFNLDGFNDSLGGKDAVKMRHGYFL